MFADIGATGTDDSPYDWAVGRAAAERAAGSLGIARPHFEPGDALVFDQMTLHSTGVRPGMTKPRYAIETWFFTPLASAAGEIPLAAG